MKQTLIQNATVYDGTGAPPFVADVRIMGSKIEAIGRNLSSEGCTTVDATGLALAPGFINPHSHMDIAVLENPALLPVLRQGITTEVVGQDGSSVAPVTEELVQVLADNVAPLAGKIAAPFHWRSFAEYLDALEEVKPAARLVSLVGHGTIRMNVMGNVNREPTEDELNQMKTILRQCMEEGAKGLSFGLIYPPGSYGNTPELREMAKVVAEYDGIIMVHMRSEKDQMLESVDEMLDVVRSSGARLQISHHKAIGNRNWGQVHDSVRKMEEAATEGYEVTFDQYPWTASCTGLKICTPPWAYAEGQEGFLRHLNVAEDYKRILQETNDEVELRGGADAILIGSVVSEEYRWMEGRYMDEISQKMELPVGEAILEILKHEGPAVTVALFCISEEDVEYLMKSPIHCLCTDGVLGGKHHPRNYSSFPRFLGRYVRERKVLSLAEAIRHITSIPAQRLHLWDRGLVRVGMDADLVLFSPETIQDLNTYLEPDIAPIGIEQVWVLGELKYTAQS